MTSEVSEMYVYITLPGETKAVTAGRYTLKPGPVGEFIYGRSYLARQNAVSIDPVQLHLQAGTVFRSPVLKGNFGALRDASPDAWGRKMIERRSANPNPTEIDYMLNSPDDRAGALGFGLSVEPPAPVREFNRTMDLTHVMEIADGILASEEDADTPAPTGTDATQVERLIRAGTSMGGARPKATVEDASALWLAKFSTEKDKWNNPAVEHAMMLLAHECGIEAAETRLERVGDRDVLLVRRFDRKKTDAGYERFRMVSAMTLLQADESNDYRKWSYLLLADEIQRIAGRQAMKDLPQLFRRICFNALISNTDDHPRNHAIIAPGDSWHLSPAYDLTPTPTIAQDSRYLAMAFGTSGRYANRTNLLSESGRFNLSMEEATAIVDAMTLTVRNRWNEFARKAGVSVADCEKIRTAFEYPGFEYSLEPDQNNSFRP
jgi:serine/threonine-protein kinase HipA